MREILTPRLRLRPFVRGDAPVAYGWLGDSEVMRYTPAGPDASLTATERRLDRYQEHQARHGFSKWIVLDRTTGQAIGDAGLLVMDEPVEGFRWTELGFRFAQPCWGKGLATEVGRAWASAAFEEVGLDRLGAFVHMENAASSRVLEKLSFQRIGPAEVMGMPSVLFSLERATSG